MGVLDVLHFGSTALQDYGTSEFSLSSWIYLSASGGVQDLRRIKLDLWLFIKLIINWNTWKLPSFQVFENEEMKEIGMIMGMF